MNTAIPEIKVSIVITCYNLEHFIGEAIQSLLHQRCDFAYEIIVIDDASTDGSREVIGNIRDPRLVTIFLEKNVGAAQAINTAYSRARGIYVCRFDGDDMWYPDYLQKAAGILDTHADVVLVHSDVTFIDEHGNITSERNNISRPVSLKPADYEFSAILHKYYINAPAIMARKSSWDKVLPWSETFRSGLGDWYYSLSMLENNLSYFISEPLAYYRIHTTNMHRAMYRNRVAETNTYLILDTFRNKPNSITPTEWSRIYYEQNRHLGFSYYSAGMEKDAARCLKRAVKYRPAAMTDMGFVRIWFASMVGKNFYTRMKSLVGK